MKSARRVLRGILAGLSRDWREAARSLGLEIYAVAALPVGAAFAFDLQAGTIWAPLGDEGYGWAAWAGITAIVAARNSIEVGVSDICALANERLCASGLFVVSNSA